MRLTAVLAVSVLVFAAPAWAQQQRGQALEQFMQLDTDGNGSVSRAEAERGRVAMFARLDTNRDGVLSESERASGSGSPQPFARADSNRDGAVSRAEAMAAPYRIFDRLDRNDDNTVSAAELETVRAQMGGG